MHGWVRLEHVREPGWLTANVPTFMERGRRLWASSMTSQGIAFDYGRLESDIFLSLLPPLVPLAAWHS